MINRTVLVGRLTKDPELRYTQTRSFENKEGQRVYVTEVVANSVQFLESKGNHLQQQQSRQSDPFAGEGETKWTSQMTICRSEGMQSDLLILTS